MTEYDVIVCGGGPAGSTPAFYAAKAGMKVLLLDKSKEPVKHPLIEEIFSGKKGSNYFKISN